VQTGRATSALRVARPVPSTHNPVSICAITAPMPLLSLSRPGGAPRRTRLTICARSAGAALYRGLDHQPTGFAIGAPARGGAYGSGN